MLRQTLHSLLYRNFIRPVLFCLDAEKSHDLTLSLLSKTQRTALRSLYQQPKVDDPVELLGLSFPNKVGLAAGLDKNAACIDAFEAMGFGFIEVGTVTPLAQSGNPKPRMFRIVQKNALINRFGFNNLGLQSFITNVERAQCKSSSAKSKVLIGLNIGKNAVTPIEDATSDYLICLKEVYPYADYVTINISSPNTKNLRSLQSDAALDELLQSLEVERAKLMKVHAKRVPMFLKIAPDLDGDQMKVIAQSLQRVSSISKANSNEAPDSAGYWGLIATNTTLSRAAVEGLPNADQTGGLSGAPVLEASNAVIQQMRELLGPDFVIIGVGGIMSAKDAVSKLRAGANLVQIYSGLIYAGPSLVSEVAQALKSVS
jgi:dihydroorotate dehydrogenase